MSNAELYDEVVSLLGGECFCGGDALECTDECCPPDDYQFCQKDTLVKLKRVLVERWRWVMEDMKRVLNHALLDIDWLLVHGFDTDVDDCTIPGVR